jgi:hypothetical protein
MWKSGIGMRKTRPNLLGGVLEFRGRNSFEEGRVVTPSLLRALGNTNVAWCLGSRAHII